MKAVVQNAYGSPYVLQIKEINKPEPKAHEVLVQVHAAAFRYLEESHAQGKVVITTTTAEETKRDTLVG